MSTTKTNETTYKVGDYLCCDWGLSQRYVDYFLVVGVTAKSLKIVPVKNKRVKTERWASWVMPTDEPKNWCVFDRSDSLEKNGYMLKRMGRYGISLGDGHVAKKWDGTPQMEMDLD